MPTHSLVNMRSMPIQMMQGANSATNGLTFEGLNAADNSPQIKKALHSIPTMSKKNRALNMMVLCHQLVAMMLQHRAYAMPRSRGEKLRVCRNSGINAI